jgi:phosphoribosylformylglycinamidine cyclo-ligase
LSWSYERAGVNLKRVKATHSTIDRLIQKTYGIRRGKSGRVLLGSGHYASLIDIGQEKAIAVHCDGCGTKVLVAQLMNKFDTIGIDCVAMCVNDLICLGVEPVTLVDYLALERPDEALVNEIMKGLVKAAEIAKITIIGGETAIMPDVIRGAVPKRGFDLAAFCLGLVRKKSVISGNKLTPGDAIVGIESSGIHSNGFSLARSVLIKKAKRDLNKRPPELRRPLGEELLEPTRIYLDPVMLMIENINIHAIAHITGGAFTKLRRFEPHTNVGFHLDNVPDPPPIFKLIQKVGRIPDQEMYRTFNMGIGLCVMTPKKNIEQVASSCKASGFKTHEIGRVVERTGVRIDVHGKTLAL